MSELDNQIKNLIDNDRWIIYCQPEYRKCPNCDVLKELFSVNRIDFESVDIFTPESATELAVRDVFPKYTPVLQKGSNVYYKQLWSDHGVSLNIPRIKYIVDSKKEDWIDVSGSECKDGVCKI